MSSLVPFIDREQSWLAFNQRVLELAEDESIPLLERIRYLTIFASNLDEFYMVRVGSVLGKIELGMTSANSAGLTPKESLEQISLMARELATRHARLFKNDLLPELRKNGIELITWDDLTDIERGYVTKQLS